MMPEIDAAGCRLFYVAEGPPEAPTLLLSNALGTTSALWEAQLPGLRRSFRVVRYDTRGHGRSAAPAGPYALERLGHDALAVLDAAGAGRSHVCGISLGGLTALWLGIHAPERVGRLVIANSAARIGTAALWQERVRDARQQGMSALADAASARWFTPGFRERDPKTVEAFRRGLAACALEGYVGCCAALAQADLRREIGAIAAPSLVIAGRHDVATPPAAGKSLHAGIPGARLVALEAAHLSNVEAAETFTSAVVEFLSS